MSVQIKRVYDEPSQTDGYRVLVDRLWPRGLTKDRAALDRWDKDVAPSDALRRHFKSLGMSEPEFRKLYRQELRSDPQAIDSLLEAHRKSRKKRLTLLYASRDPIHNHAVTLRREIERRIERRQTG